MKDIPPTVDTDDWVDFLAVEGVVSVPQGVVVAKQVDSLFAISY